MKKIANNKATEKVNVSVKLVKNAPGTVYKKGTTFQNNLFGFHEDIESGTLILVLLQKPTRK